jgi:hypothetical protein
MSKQSEAVKKWRTNCKKRIIVAMGGACCCCGYNKCDWALALHHLDPTQKDISLGAVRANPQNWNLIVEELRKCVLVCHVCHSEIHAGIRIVPIDASKFDEKFADYKALENKPEELSACPVCGKIKPIHLKNCSTDCAHRSRYKIDWNSIIFIEELKKKSIVQLAEELGCSDAAIHKRMKKLGLK